jgi:lipopolysaccharide transport system ATP-binding protein
MTIEFEYNLSAPISGLRVGLYVLSTRGEFIFTTFDTDEPSMYENYTVRNSGHYFSRCTIPANTFNEGRFVIGVNASTYRIKRYFQDEQAMTFTIDPAGAPGMQWPEQRQGPIRPRLFWQIEGL